MEIHAIETVYEGYRFRSRLEAKWACVFDVLGWEWQYEPIDLKGYIPDFVLDFYKPILVEVKPVLTRDDFDQYYPKLLRSGWDGEILLVGAKLFNTDEGCGYQSIGMLHDGNCWSSASFHYCTNCQSYSFHHGLMVWSCRKSGCYEGEHFLGIPEEGYLDHVWAYASNLTKYINKPRHAHD
jgi:hypothetical protein